MTKRSDSGARRRTRHGVYYLHLNQTTKTVDCGRANQGGLDLARMYCAGVTLQGSVQYWSSGLGRDRYRRDILGLKLPRIVQAVKLALAALRLQPTLLNIPGTGVLCNFRVYHGPRRKKSASTLKLPDHESDEPVSFCLPKPARSPSPSPTLRLR